MINTPRSHNEADATLYTPLIHQNRGEGTRYEEWRRRRTRGTSRSHDEVDGALYTIFFYSFTPKSNSP